MREREREREEKRERNSATPTYLNGAATEYSRKYSLIYIHTNSVPITTCWQIGLFSISVLQHTATRCNTLSHTATHCIPLFSRERLSPITTCWQIGLFSRSICTCVLQHTTMHCNTLKYTAIHCNTLADRALFWVSLRVYSEKRPFFSNMLC